MAGTAMDLASRVQLDMIDGLRGLGISNFVALPQVRDAPSLGFLAKTWQQTACRNRRLVEVWFP
jgi:hypothetical protein